LELAAEGFQFLAKPAYLCAERFDRDFEFGDTVGGR